MIVKKMRSSLVKALILLSVAAIGSGCTKAELIGKKLLMGKVSILSIFPASGARTGGTFVTITGTGFLPGSTVSIGGQACQGVTVVNLTTITCTTPAGALGDAPVSVTVPAAGPVASTVSYLYLGVMSASSRISSGGGIKTATGMVVTTTVGAVFNANGNMQTGTGMKMVGGVKGFQY